MVVGASVHMGLTDLSQEAGEVASVTARVCACQGVIMRDEKRDGVCIFHPLTASGQE